jgi:hypothetical protein
MVLNDGTLLRGVEGCHDASFNTTEQRGILRHHGAAWHPSTPRSTVASFNTMDQRGILQHHMPRCSMVLKDATLLQGVE